jgi:D-alanyl-D-alanine carboxypeptidase
VFLVIAAIAAAFGYQSLASSSSTAVPSTVSLSSTASLPSTSELPATVPRSAPRAALGEAGGAIPGGTTVFDGGVPGVARLDPALLAALRRAASDAAGEGVEFLVDSGWRSRAYQQELLEQAIEKYGSDAEAARWVATPTTSAHVSGKAIDIGRAAAAWLSQHGSRYGLCQIYRNESWHFERRPRAIDHGCPPMYADPTQDPRMQQ